MENENKALKLSRQQIIMVSAAAVLVVVLALVFLLWPGNVLDQLTIEAGASEVSANAFLKKDEGETAAFITDMTAIDLCVPGEYPVQILYRDKSYDSVLVIEDTIAPEATVQNLAVYSDETPDPADFIVSVKDATAVATTYKTSPDMTKEGSQLLMLVVTDAAGNTAEYEVVLTVFVDTGAPEITGVRPLFTYIGTEPDYLAGVSAMDDQDLDLQIIVDTAKVDLAAIGTYDISYSVTDNAGNTTTVPSTVTVTNDNTAPTILGVHNLSLYLGSAVSYRGGVQVTDDKDPNPTLEVDSSQVDLSNVGVYPLVYTARDMTGNETRIEVTVTVEEKPSTYMEEDKIYAKADELLTKIVSDNMTAEAKVRAIYSYVRSHYTYSGHSDKTDWLQGAWVMMDEGEGDCFNYFAITKLLLERSDIPNIDVRKVRNYEGDSDHYWSLVSVDGGNTYYHLDTTPRVGDGDDFCLVTDAFLDAYSAANKNCHNRDKSLYPTTPEE